MDGGDFSQPLDGSEARPWAVHGFSTESSQPAGSHSGLTGRHLQPPLFVALLRLTSDPDLDSTAFSMAAAAQVPFRLGQGPGDSHGMSREGSVLRAFRGCLGCLSPSPLCYAVFSFVSSEGLCILFIISVETEDSCDTSSLKLAMCLRMILNSLSFAGCSMLCPVYVML